MPPYNAASWKQLLTSDVERVQFTISASGGDVAALEHTLGLRLPDDLRELLFETDGVKVRHSELIWSTADIVARNQEFRRNPEFRSLYMPFEHLLLFGDDGGGDHFAYAIDGDGEIRRPDIFRWEHELDSRSWFAARLEDFCVRRLKPGSPLP